MSLTTIMKCAEYREDLLREKMLEACAHAGIDFSSLKGRLVALKPNLLTSARAERGVATELRFFRAAAGLVKDFGGRCVIIESPSIQRLEAVMRKTGYLETARHMGIEIADDSESAEIHWEGARRYKTAEVIHRLLDVDAVLNLPKCKTHSLTFFTGALKNLFGLMPGMRKARMHMKAPGAREFSEFLIDFYGALMFGLPNRPEFMHIMDAVVGLEGEGPGPSGIPVRLEAVIAGRDALAVDLAAVRTAGLDEKRVLTLELAYGHVPGIASRDELRLAGDYKPPQGFRSFRPAGSSFFERFARWPRAFRVIKNLLVEKPLPLEGPCTLCYQCSTICPAGAISAAAGEKRIPLYDYGACIRCFCCMEICPEGAIAKKRGALQGLLGR